MQNQKTKKKKPTTKIFKFMKQRKTKIYLITVKVQKKQHFYSKFKLLVLKTN